MTLETHLLENCYIYDSGVENYNSRVFIRCRVVASNNRNSRFESFVHLVHHFQCDQIGDLLDFGQLFKVFGNN